MKQRVNLENAKDDVEKERLREIEALGPFGCRACMAHPCRWEAMVDVPKLQNR